MKNRIYLVGLVAAFSLIATACQLDVERNSDGTLQIEAVIDESDIATEIAFGLDDPDNESVTVDLEDGYALIAVEAEREWGSGTDQVSFRMDLFVVDGHLGAEVSDAVWNGVEIPEEMVAVWNEELAAELEASAKEEPDSTLVEVEITEDQLRFEFQVETEQSKG